MKFTGPQRKLLNEANDLASLQQHEQSLIQNLARISDPNSKTYRQVYAQYEQVKKRMEAFKKPQQSQQALTPREKAERAAQKLRNIGLGLDDK